MIPALLGNIAAHMFPIDYLPGLTRGAVDPKVLEMPYIKIGDDLVGQRPQLFLTVDIQRVVLKNGAASSHPASRASDVVDRNDRNGVARQGVTIPRLHHYHLERIKRLFGYDLNIAERSQISRDIALDLFLQVFTFCRDLDLDCERPLLSQDRLRAQADSGESYEDNISFHIGVRYHQSKGVVNRVLGGAEIGTWSHRR